MCVCVCVCVCVLMECHAGNPRLTTAVLVTPGSVTFQIPTKTHKLTNVLFATEQRLKQTTRRMETVSKYVYQQHFS